MAVRRGVYLLLLSLALALAGAGSARASTRTITLGYGPVAMGGFNVEFPKVPVPAPAVAAYVVGMHADLEDAHGRTVTIREVMLHHTVFYQRRQTVGLN